jgi:hypothetical protein
MTMIDEGTLITALRHAADEFTISKDATARILTEARFSTHDRPIYRIRTLYRHYGRGRTVALAVAAGVVIASDHGAARSNRRRNDDRRWCLLWRHSKDGSRFGT